MHLEKVNTLTNRDITLDLSSGISQVIIHNKNIYNEENLEKIEEKYLSKLYE